MSSFILKDQFENFDENIYHNFRNQWSRKNKIFLPCNINNSHWILFYVEPKQRHVYLLDSGQTKEDPESYMINFQKFYRLVFPKMKSNNWQVKNMIFPSQNDSANCGIDVLYFIEQ